MRFSKFIDEKNTIQTALNINEPEIGKKYSKRIIEKNKEAIEKAISKLGKPNNNADEAILSDLEDKLDKWNNVKKETEPVGPFKEEPVEEKPPPEEKSDKEEEPEDEKPEEEK